MGVGVGGFGSEPCGIAIADRQAEFRSTEAAYATLLAIPPAERDAQAMQVMTATADGAARRYEESLRSELAAVVSRRTAYGMALPHH